MYNLLRIKCDGFNNLLCFPSLLVIIISAGANPKKQISDTKRVFIGKSLGSGRFFFAKQIHKWMTMYCTHTYIPRTIVRCPPVVSESFSSPSLGVEIYGFP